MSTPGTLDLNIRRGETYIRQFQWLNPDGVTPIDLTGCTLHSQFRKNALDTTTILDLSLTNGRLALQDAVNGVFQMFLSSEDTTDFPADFRIGAWDLFVLDTNGFSKPLIAGRVVITASVTRYTSG